MTEKMFEVGKTYLMKQYSNGIFEGKVLQVSPSRKRIKVEYTLGETEWLEVEDTEIVEALD